MGVFFYIYNKMATFRARQMGGKGSETTIGAETIFTFINPSQSAYFFIEHKDTDSLGQYTGNSFTTGSFSNLVNIKKPAMQGYTLGVAVPEGSSSFTFDPVNTGGKVFFRGTGEYVLTTANA